MAGRQQSSLKNRRPHVLDNNADILDAGIEKSWNIAMQGQPSRSPDMNVLDSEVFSSISSV